jgi:hypothetical protein
MAEVEARDRIILDADGNVLLFVSAGRARATVERCPGANAQYRRAFTRERADELRDQRVRPPST